MARVRRQVDRRDDLIADEMDGVEIMRETDEVLIVGEIAGPAAVDLVVHVGRAGDQPEDQRIAADVEPARRIAARKRERSRGGSQRGGDQALVAAHQPLAAIDDRAGAREERKDPLAQDAHAKLGENSHRRAMHGVELIGAEDCERRIRVMHASPRQLGDAAIPPSGLGLASAAPVLRHRASSLRARRSNVAAPGPFAL